MEERRMFTIYNIEKYLWSVDSQIMYSFIIDEQSNINAVDAKDKEFMDSRSKSIIKEKLFELENKLSSDKKSVTSVEMIGNEEYLFKLILLESKKILLIQDNVIIKSIKKTFDEINSLRDQIINITDSLYDGIFVIDIQGTVIWANKAYQRITGITLDAVIGHSIFELQEENIISPIIAPTIIQTKKFFTVLQTFKTGKNAIVTGSPVFDSKGEIKYIVSNVRDITELNLLLKELRKANELTESYKTQISLIQIQKLGLDNIVANSSKMRSVITSALHVSQFDTTVFLSGETGVGKEVIAKLIYTSSYRSKKPYITINCGALAPNLLESELFGYEAGAFTGASNKGKPGLFELANEGTLFLDEIGDLPYELQVKLLRVLQEQEIQRVGGVTSIKVNVRIITATNRNLEELVKAKKFREDLYYRLNVVPIEIPPLIERKEDVGPLLLHFCDFFNKKYNMRKHFSVEILDCLERYSWPGNIRELKNVVEFLVVMNESNELLPKHLPKHINTLQNENLGIKVNSLMPLKQASLELEKQLILMAKKSCGSVKKIAKILGVSESTVVRRLREVREAGNNV